MKKTARILLLIIADLIISWIVFYICDVHLHSVMGPDIIEYENWSGELDETIVHRFGIGSLEITLSAVQMLVFAVTEFIRARKNKGRKALSISASVIHILNGIVWILFYIDWNSLMQLPEFFSSHLPQYIVQKLLV